MTQSFDDSSSTDDCPCAEKRRTIDRQQKAILREVAVALPGTNPIQKRLATFLETQGWSEAARQTIPWLMCAGKDISIPLNVSGEVLEDVKESTF